MTEFKADGNTRFTVFAVRRSNPTALLQFDLPWERLMTDIVTPFESGETFFVDGAPVKATDLDRLKILLNSENFSPVFHRLHWTMRTGDAKHKEVLAKQYSTFIEGLIRENTRDVTSQVISAFRTEIKPRLKDWLPNKTEILDASIKLFAEGMKAWAH